MIVGVIGGGQLARMMIPPAVALGIDLRVFSENEGESAVLATKTVGNYRNVDELLRFAEGVDVITFDHEQVPQEVLRELVARGVTVRPSPDALLFAQNKLRMRERLTALGVPVPEWAAVTNRDQLDAFLAAHNGQAVVKAARGGYDGHGVRVVSAAGEADDWFARLDAGTNGKALLAEELVRFDRELSQLVARRPSGKIMAWPVVESIQRGGVCEEVIAPAPSSAGKIAELASEIAFTIAENLGVTGVLAVELFETTDHRLLVNELAMRPHNTGHWTIEGSTTSQFEQHLRAVLDLPLGATGCRAPWSVMVNVLGGPPSGALSDRYTAALASRTTVKVHNYGKELRPGRKVGHVTATGADLDEVVAEARAAAAAFTA